MIFLNNPIAHNKFPKTKKYSKRKCKIHKKIRVEFFDNAHLHTTPKLGGVIAQKKRYRSRLADNIFTAKPRYAQGLLRYDNACFNDYADN